MAEINEGDSVSWEWATGRANGTVKSVFHERTERTIKGTEVVRNGTEDDPALYIEVDDGGAALKLASEVDKE